MATAPLGSTDRGRAFLLRRQELLARLRWAGARSRRRRELQAELDRLVRAELEAEMVRQQPSLSTGPYGGKRPYWVDK